MERSLAQFGGRLRRALGDAGRDRRVVPTDCSEIIEEEEEEEEEQEEEKKEHQGVAQDAAEEREEERKRRQVEEVVAVARAAHNKQRATDPEMHKGLVRKYLVLAKRASTVAQSDPFNFFIIGAIGIAGILVGVQTYESMSEDKVIASIDFVILLIFSAEVVLKVVACGLAPWNYFVGDEKYWNTFDFTIVVLVLPFWGDTFGGNSVALLRLIRLMRVMKIVRKVPQLQMIVQGLLGGVSSIGYILLLLFLVFYLYAIMGIYAFRSNDPWHFGSLPIALLNLFRASTLEDWTDMMYINIFGCREYQNVYVPDAERTPDNRQYWCEEPSHSYFVAPAYFVSFVVVSALVMLSLFVGAVTMSMSESMEDLKREQEEKERRSRFERERKKRERLMSIDARSSSGGSPDSQSSHSPLFANFAKTPRSPSYDSNSNSNSSNNNNDNDNKDSTSNTTGAVILKSWSTDTRKIKLPALKHKGGTAPHTALPAVNPERTSLSAGAVTNSDAAADNAQHLARLAAAAFGQVKRSENGNSNTNNSTDPNNDSARSPHLSARSAPTARGGGDSADTIPVLMKTVSKVRARRSGLHAAKERLRRMSVSLQNRWAVPVQTAAERRAQQRMRVLILTAFGEDVTDEEYEDESADYDGLSKVYFLIARYSRTFVEHRYFTGFVTGVIVLAGVVVGLQTDPHITSDPQAMGVISVLDIGILTVFTLEVVLKIVAEAFTPWKFFVSRWNVFDFAIVVGSFLPGTGGFLTMLRLLRLLRVLKLVKSLPQLAVIVNAMIMGLGSIGFIGIILGLCFYVFAILGMILFQTNDPFHFGTLHVSLITLLQCATLDDWTDVMYINMYGCDKYGYEDFPEDCTNPTPMGIGAALYFLLFTVLAALVLLTLFIGVVTTSMDQATQDQRADQLQEERISAIRERELIPDERVETYRNVFKLLDLDGSRTLEDEELRAGLISVGKNPNTNKMAAMKSKVELDEHGNMDLAAFIEFMTNMQKDRGYHWLTVERGSLSHDFQKEYDRRVSNIKSVAGKWKTFSSRDMRETKRQSSDETDDISPMTSSRTAPVRPVGGVGGAGPPS